MYAGGVIVRCVRGYGFGVGVGVVVVGVGVVVVVVVVTFVRSKATGHTTSTDPSCCCYDPVNVCMCYVWYVICFVMFGC